MDSHRRYLSDGVDVTNLPNILAEAIATGEESVYIRVQLASVLEDYL